ncbi:hypothetical protein B0H34DRAFT_692945 [Crassisporium funariophilum]|nr:hypothetical protein B0H34DRAFT_692945 [Crassisporium funariophilum]
MPRKSELTGILRRGSACLSCRRRKLRCDGARPVCHQCSSMRRGHECKFDDSCRKSRTQTLREKLFSLEAKVRQLEHGSSSSASSSSTTPPLSTDLQWHDPRLSTTPTTYQTDFVWDIGDFDYSNITSAFPTGHGYDQSQFDLPCSSGSSQSAEMTIPLGVALPSFLNGQTSGPVTNSSGTPTYDNSMEQFWFEPSTTLAPEMHNILVQSFIKHRKQCCFYSNTSRFDASSSATVFQHTPPNPSLMSAIYLLGSFFAQTPIPDGVEPQLLEQTLHEVSRSLHNQEQLMDVVQALSLLAQYFFFNNREMEGNRHLFAAKRMSLDLGLHLISHPDPSLFPFDLDSFGSASQDWAEKLAIFWQMFMVDGFWSVSNDCGVTSPDSEGPCRNIITPLPVREGVSMDTPAVNSTISALFEADTFHGSSLSVTAYKAMASCIFDRSMRVHKSFTKDRAAWAYQRSAEVALERLSSIIHPFAGPESTCTEEPFFDTDMYTVHTLTLASTIHLHLDNFMNLKISWAANKLVELVNQLGEDDYQFLDPVLAIAWSSIINVFRRMIETANQSTSHGAGSTASYTLAFLRHCVETLLSALHSLSNFIPIAGTLVTGLEVSYVGTNPSPLSSLITPPLPSVSNLGTGQQYTAF